MTSFFPPNTVDKYFMERKGDRYGIICVNCVRLGYARQCHGRQLFCASLLRAAYRWGELAAARHPRGGGARSVAVAAFRRALGKVQFDKLAVFFLPAAEMASVCRDHPVRC